MGREHRAALGTVRRTRAAGRQPAAAATHRPRHTVCVPRRGGAVFPGTRSGHLELDAGDKPLTQFTRSRQLAGALSILGHLE